ncbi:MAG: hypothetical protein IPP14_01305 [Planctomycetes bacterium]|nr:hypothetical protein [Planctomycetota bacterium]
MDSTSAPSNRRRPLFWVLVALVALALVLGCAATWWHGRAVTVEGAQRALKDQPQDLHELQGRLGKFTDTGSYLAALHDQSDMVNALCDHPAISSHIRWFEGRGGRAAAAQVTFLDALANPWRHGQQFSAEEMGVEISTYCIYLDKAGHILGWADISAGPSVTDAVLWQRALAAHKDPAAENGK